MKFPDCQTSTWEVGVCPARMMDNGTDKLQQNENFPAQTQGRKNESPSLSIPRGQPLHSTPALIPTLHSNKTAETSDPKTDSEGRRPFSHPDTTNTFLENFSDTRKALSFTRINID